jgi:hypothetical protein
MYRLALPHRCARRYFVTVAVLAVAALYTGVEAAASCGDYLIHGALHQSASGHAAQQGDGAHRDDAFSVSNPAHATARSGDQPPPASPCASGRCHSLPLLPPLNHPTRMSIPKQAVAVADWLCSSRDAAPLSWGFPVDGLLPQVPVLGPASPPPRAAFFQA